MVEPDQTIDERRRKARDGLNQTNASIQGIYQPLMDMWATTCKMYGETLLASGQFIENLSKQHIGL